MTPKIHADFNGPFAPIFVFVLDRFGTLRDLNAQKLKLAVGLELTVCEEDMEVDGVVKFGQLPNTHMTPPAWYLEGDREVCPHCGFDVWHAVRPPR